MDLFIVTGPTSDRVRLATWRYEKVLAALLECNDNRGTPECEPVGNNITRFFTATGAYLVHRVPDAMIGVWQ